MSAPIRTLAICERCKNQGPIDLGRADLNKPRPQPLWCTCTTKDGKRAEDVLASGGGLLPGGPLNAAPGTVVAFVFESEQESAFREKCRLAGNAYIEAKDELSSRWVRCGRGWRELPRGNPKRDRLEKNFAGAKRALRRLQLACKHPRRSIFDPACCGVCYAQQDEKGWFL